MKLLLPAAAVLVLTSLVSCNAPGSFTDNGSGNGVKGGRMRIASVKTTAYTHTESDHLVHGVKSAVGTTLKHGSVNSAAADWSVYPVGTVFKIEGQPGVYQVDDYGSALVGTNTIDLYKPSSQEMNQWGSRRVNIQVLKWGSFRKSLAIMQPRQNNNHIRRMIQRIKRSI
jgi:3D (Asp-Asp-Asp) domain-containing protein